MSRGVPPLANSIDSFTESLITRINNKIIDLMNLNLETVSLFYSSKKDYCNRYQHFIEKEKEEGENKVEQKEFFSFFLNFTSEDDVYLKAGIKYDKQEFIFSKRQFLLVSKEENDYSYFQARVIDLDKTQKKVTDLLSFIS